MMLNIAAFLDPRFRALSFLSEEEKLAVLSKVEKEAGEVTFGSADHSAESQHPEERSGGPPQKRSRSEKHLMA